MKLSIIIPVYNSEKWLENCVSSILTQDYQNFELILVDDGSSDHSGILCDALARKDSRIVVVHKSNGGQGSARNIGLDLAKGDLVTFVDSDDAVSKETYSLNLPFFDEDKIDLVQYPCTIKYGTDFPVTKYEFYCSISGTENLFKSWLMDKVISNYVCNKIFRKSFFDSLRFPEGMYFEDRYLMSEILEKCYMARLSDYGMYYYYQRSNQVTSKPDSAFILESKIKADLNIVKHTMHFKSLRSLVCFI